ncbi:MAG: hypothetical protein EXR89_02135 [Methylococcaceae bacterium]|nr:hypothetical protein [Methylococcaceae bacterium]
MIYCLVYPAKYKRAIYDEKVGDVLKSICLEIEKKYQIQFLEIATDKGHVHFLMQSIATYSITKIVTMIK